MLFGVGYLNSFAVLWNERKKNQLKMMDRFMSDEKTKGRKICDGLRLTGGALSYLFVFAVCRLILTFELLAPVCGGCVFGGTPKFGG